MIAFLFIIFIYMTVLADQTLAYSAEEMTKDRDSINMVEFIPYRGSILKDIWIDPPTITREKEVCIDLFRKALATVNGTSNPPREIPSHDKDAYLLGGKVVLHNLYYNNVYNGVHEINWTTAFINQYRAKPNTCAYYHRTYCDEIIKKYVHYLQGKDVAVIGSEYPWAEAAILNVNPQRLYTIEYSKIYSDYPNFSAFHPSEVAKVYLKHEWNHLDAAFSYSSLEHDGLGRYGDPLSPFADLESIARIRCLLKPGGVLFLGIPVGADTLAWNAHRIYGKYRLALVSLGWEILDFHPTTVRINGSPGGFDQPIMVFQKPLHSTHGKTKKSEAN